MQVTHVLRAQEHLANTPKHILLQDALGFSRPAYAHLSIILNPDGSKMSKRDKDRALRGIVRERGLTGVESIDAEMWRWWQEGKDHQLDLPVAERLAKELDVELPEINVEDFRRAGYLPEALVNYLALLGWSPGHDIEQFDRDFLIKNFDLNRFQKSSARFDRKKLLAFNHDAIQAMSPGEFLSGFRAHCLAYHPVFLTKLTPEEFDLLATANHARSKTFEDPVRSCRFFLIGDEEVVYEDSRAVRKVLVKGDPSGFDHLEGVRRALEPLTDWTQDMLEREIRTYVEASAVGKLGNVAQPLRVAVSGGTVSPAIFETLMILGRDSVLRRINRCLELRAQFDPPP